MRAEIISIGTELLLGHIVNTNAAFLSRRLSEMGIDLYNQTTVGDNPMRLANAIREALKQSDIVITSGGLGPTVDDITARTVVGLAGKSRIRWIKNMVGTAPGLIVKYHDKPIFCLPGPPRELEPMFEREIIPFLRKHQAFIIKSRTIKTTGLAESKVNRIVKDLLQLKPPTTVGIYAKLGEVDLKIMAKAQNDHKALAAIKRIEKKINPRLKEHIFGYDDETLEGAVAKILTKNKKTIAVAESCTGGLVSNRLTNVSGSSKYFASGLIAYSNESKESFLGVSAQSLKKYGAVSKQVAFEMAKGIKHFACVDIGVGITGIAGPSGGSKSKPVGLVYIALAIDKKRLVREFRFRGSREEIKFRASQIALDMIRRNI